LYHIGKAFSRLCAKNMLWGGKQMKRKTFYTILLILAIVVIAALLGAVTGRLLLDNLI